MVGMEDHFAADGSSTAVYMDHVSGIASLKSYKNQETYYEPTLTEGRPDLQEEDEVTYGENLKGLMGVYA